MSVFKNIDDDNESWVSLAESHYLQKRTGSGRKKKKKKTE